jgi:dipeptidyl aminopeptidase/acylaminoacyl peptidase
MRGRLFVIVFFCALPVAAQTKHPFTFEDMMALKRVEEPVPSPDGKWVLFAAVDVDLKANTKTPHVWVVPLGSNIEKSGVAHPSPVLARVGDTNEPKAEPALSLSKGPSTVQKDSQANPSASLGMRRGERSGEKEIISDQDADRPRWAPDGKRFAFVSTKENGSQIWIADFDGATGTVTAKHRLTNISTEADGELWSPDGKNILFKSDVYPECDGAAVEESACNAKKLEEAKNSKVKAQIFKHLLYRHWNAYKGGKRTHLFVFPVFNLYAYPGGAGPVTIAGNRSRDLTPGDYDAPVFSLGGQDDYAFSPDGQEICYASNHDPEPAISTNNDLFTVPVNFPPDATSKDVLAATKDITAENKAADNTPLYSPDGKYIAYRAQQRPGYESDRWRLMLYDRKTGKKTPFGAPKSLDFWVGTFAWANDSSKIYFVAEEKGESPIYSVSFKIQGPQFEPGYDIAVGGSSLDCMQIARGFNDDLFVTPDGKTLFFTRMSVAFPNEIFAAPVPPLGMSDLISSLKLNIPESEGKKNDCCGVVLPITHLNNSVLSQVSMSPLDPFWFTGAHGDQVQGFLVKPPNFDPNKKYPVKFIVHGGPEVPFGDEWSYRWNFELFAANGYVVVFINFHGSPGYGQKFIDAINGDWGGAPFEDLMKGLDYAEAHYGFIDKDRECALGASYGGYMANWILGHTNRFKCIVTHDSMFNAESAWGTTEELWFNEWEFKGTPYTNREMYRKWSPHLFATNFKTPTLVIHSQLDYRLDVSQGFDLFTTLQRQGVPSKMLYFPDEGHWVLKPQNSQLWYKTVNDWVDQWVGGGVPGGHMMGIVASRQ